MLKRRRFLVTILTLLGTLPSGIAVAGSTEVTPPGDVPPAPESLLEELRARDLMRHGELPIPEVEPPPRRREEPRPSGVQTVLDRFRTAYTAQGRPNLALYLNRELSADVREWNTVGGKVTVTANSETQASKSGEWTRKEQDGGNLELLVGPSGSDGRRSGPGEGWLWDFENNLVEPFLRADCRLIDRATILRLEAARARTGVDYAGLAAKKVEMDALAGHADVLIEVLVLRSSASAGGYQLKATAKELRSGRILANVTSSGRVRRRSEWVATPEGYQERQIVIPPTVRELSEGLTTELMAALARAWS